MQYTVRRLEPGNQNSISIPGKGLRQNTLKGRDASRMPLTPLPLTCTKLFPGKHVANCPRGCQPGPRGRDSSAASAG